MSFAVRNDGRGFWAVGGPDEVGPDQWYSVDRPTDPQPTDDDLAQEAVVRRNSFLAVAASRMGPLQDAVDTGRATEVELAHLTLWKEYRVDLNRIEQQEGFPSEILWPLSPDELMTKTPSQ